MKKPNVEALVGTWVEELLAGSERELVDVEFVKEGPNWVLRVLLDKPDGIDIEDCQEVSMALSERLDEEDPIPQAYSLEVSSPGLERPLKKASDYQRFVGETVNLRTYSAVDGRKKFTGTLLGLEEGMVRLELESGPIAIPFDQVAKANLHVEF